MRDGVINGLIVPAQVEEEPGHLDVDRPQGCYGVPRYARSLLWDT